MKKDITPEEMAVINARLGEDKPTSEAAQVRRVLEHLQTQAGGLNRYEAERYLNVCQLAPRIVTIKEMGYPVLTIRECADDPYGQTHSGIARYFLTVDATLKQVAV